MFAPVGDGSTRRRASDAVRAGLSALVVAVAILFVRAGTTVEGDVVDALHPAPAGISWLVSALWFIGSIGAILAVVGLALLARRFRLARDTALAGIATWLTCALFVVLLGDDGGRPADSVVPGVSADIPLARIAVAIAVVSMVAPSLSRPFRRALLALVGLASVAAVLQGSGFPLAVLASLAVGWGVAAAVRLVVESPSGLPAPSAVVDAAAELGVDLSDVAAVHPQVWGVAQFTAALDADAVEVSVYGRDASDAQLLAKVWRFLWYRDSGPTLSLTRLQQVEHEAYLTLAARHAGVRASDVLVAASAPSGDEALLVTVAPPGRPLADVDAERLSPAVLDAIFEQLRLLRQAGIAHGELNGTSVVVDEDGTVGLRGFRNATSSAPADRLDRDVAGLLVGLALRADPKLVVDAAGRTLGADALEAALPHIQPAALDRVDRHAVRHHKELLGKVRDLAAAEVGAETPELAKIHRVSLSSLLMGIGALVGVILISRELAGTDDLWATMQTAAIGWVVLCFLVAQSTNAAQALSVMGSVSVALPFGPTLELELANAFTGLVGGTVGTTATIIRFFQRRGLAVSVAVTSGLLVSLAGMIAQAVLFVIAFALSHDDFSWGTSGSSSSSGGGSSYEWLLWVIAGLALVIGLVTALPRVRQLVVAKVRPQVAAARTDLSALARQPGKLVRLFGGAVGAQLLFAITLGCALHAYGQSLSLAALLVINTLASLIGGIAPVPGGMGVIEAGLIAGFTAAGVPPTDAVAATFTARLFTCYLPPIWGYPTLAYMRHREYL